MQLATSSVNARGFNLKRAVVISEAEHDSNYTMQAPDEVVFVLPDYTRLGTPFAAGSSSLLDTAPLADGLYAERHLAVLHSVSGEAVCR